MCNGGLALSCSSLLSLDFCALLSIMLHGNLCINFLGHISAALRRRFALTVRPCKCLVRRRLTGTCDHCGGMLEQRVDDHPTIVQKRVREYQAMAEPLLQYYRERKVLEQVDVAASTAVCTPRIVDIVQRRLGLH